jgi:hypothetical protein
MLTWFPGDESPEEEWNSITLAYFTLKISPESVDTAVLFEALKNILKTANETGKNWDVSTQIANAIVNKNFGKHDIIS